MNSRAKGSRNERVAAKLVSDWTGYKFERTPSSGGLQWKSNFSKGDIVCTEDIHYHPFCWEIKAHKEIDFSQMIIPGRKNVKVFEFIDQCYRDAIKARKVPILMMRYDGMPKDFFYLAIPTKFYLMIRKAEGLTLSMRFASEGYNFTILRSTEFLSLPYRDIRKIAKLYITQFYGKKENTKRKP